MLIKGKTPIEYQKDIQKCLSILYVVEDMTDYKNKNLSEAIDYLQKTKIINYL